MWNSNSVSVFYGRWCGEIYHTITFNGIEFIWISWGLHSPSPCSRVANVPDYIWFERVLKEEKKTFYLRNMCVFCQSLKCICIAFSGIYMPFEEKIFNEYSTTKLRTFLRYSTTELTVFIQVSLRKVFFLFLHQSEMEDSLRLSLMSIKSCVALKPLTSNECGVYSELKIKINLIVFQ